MGVRYLLLRRLSSGGQDSALGLTLSGLPAEQATSAVLLFRLLTFWLPVLPGWGAFAYLQRREAL